MAAGDQRRRRGGLDEATLRRLLAGYLAPRSDAPGLGQAEVELLEKSIGSRRVLDGIFSSDTDALGES